MKADHLLAISASVCMSVEICISRHRYSAVLHCYRSTGQPAQCSVWAGYEVLLTSPLSAAALNGRKGRVVGTVDILQFPRNQNWTSEMGEVR